MDKKKIKKDLIEIFKIGLPIEMIADIAEAEVELELKRIRSKRNKDDVPLLNDLHEYLQKEGKQEQLITIFNELNLALGLLDHNGKIIEITNENSTKKLVRTIIKDFSNSITNPPSLDKSETYSKLDDGEKQLISTIYTLCIEGMKKTHRLIR